VASKAESQEICFVAANDYRGFMRRYAISSDRRAPTPGPIVDTNGARLGEHQGLAYYTIGQRKGLGVSSREPLHVLRLDAATNAVVVGSANQLDRNEFFVGSLSFTSGDTPSESFSAQVKVRYKAEPQAGMITPLADGRALVRLERPQRAITPGQAAVFYGGEAGDEVLGGGLIEG
jgi:tRNA-specific 2-thiouridylase